MITFELPYPPSVNHYWRVVNGRPLISKEGRLYRLRVMTAVGNPLRIMFGDVAKDRLAVTVQVMPPDRRKRDIDNVLKSLLDAIQKAGVYRDDSQIDELFVKRRDVVPGGSVLVSVRRLETA